jgi:hypothetical protein
MHVRPRHVHSTSYSSDSRSDMFLRFIRLLMIIFAVFTAITWPILLPIDAAGVSNPTREGLDKLSWGKYVYSCF